jgi:hypothetical protein
MEYHRSIINELTIIFQIALSAILLYGCGGYAIKYDFKKSDFINSDSARALQVVILPLDDMRPPEERLEQEREALDKPEAGNYTCDEEFKGTVSEEISKMIAKHLKHSKVFSRVEFRSVPMANANEKFLDSLRAKGVDMILVGEIDHFYSYYWTDGMDLMIPATLELAIGVPLMVVGINQHVDKLKTQSLLETSSVEFDPMVDIVPEIGCLVGGMIGSVIVNSRTRPIEWHTEIAVKLVSTTNSNIVWEDTLSSYKNDRKVFSGFGSNKFDLLMESLQDVTNQMVISICKSQFQSE